LTRFFTGRAESFVILRRKPMPVSTCVFGGGWRDLGIWYFVFDHQFSYGGDAEA
jgi:hypothetical protein